MGRSGFLAPPGRIEEAECLIEEDFTHALVLGQTGSGKTASVILPNIEARIRSGHGLLIFDYKGTEFGKVLALAERHGRLGDCVHLLHPLGEPVDLLGTLAPEERASFFETLCGGTENESHRYWAQNAAALMDGIVRAVELIGRIAGALRDPDSEALRTLPYYRSAMGEIGFRTKEKREPAGTFVYPTTLTFSGLQAILADMRRLVVFCGGLGPLCLRLEEESRASLRDLMFDSDSPETFERRCVEKIPLFRDLESLRSVSTALKSYGKLSIHGGQEASGDYGIVSVARTSLTQLSDRDELNAEMKGLDAIGRLSTGGVVIVDTSGVPPVVASHLMTSVVSGLKRKGRFTDRRVRPVTIFMDEANQNLTPETRLEVDVLREARVEIVLAAQNESQMIEKFGLHRWKSLAENFSKKYILKNTDPYLEDLYGREFHAYRTGECYMAARRKRVVCRPVPLEEKEIRKAKARYDSSLPRIRECVARTGDKKWMEALDKGVVAVVFDKELYRADSTVTLVNIVTDETIDIFAQETPRRMKLLVERLKREFERNAASFSGSVSA